MANIYHTTKRLHWLLFLSLTENRERIPKGGETRSLKNVSYLVSNKISVLILESIKVPKGIPYEIFTHIPNKDLL